MGYRTQKMTPAVKAASVNVDRRERSHAYTDTVPYTSTLIPNPPKDGQLAEVVLRGCAIIITIEPLGTEPPLVVEAVRE